MHIIENIEEIILKMQINAFKIIDNNLGQLFLIGFFDCSTFIQSQNF